MGKPNEQTQIGGATTHVGDCYIWAEIYYLDSATDYREYILPSIRETASDFGELVMLDEMTPSPLHIVLRTIAMKAASVLHAVNTVVRLCLGIQN